LEQVARRLRPALRGGKAPALYFFTDPERSPDPVAVAEQLPAGAALVFRWFGRADAPRIGRDLRQVTRRRGVMLLVGADEALGAALSADGMHLPERLVARAPLIRARRPGWILTGAAHSEAALAAAATACLDAAVVSPVFRSRSPSAAQPIGPLRLAMLTRQARLPVIALGGVDARTAKRLVGTGVAGLAAVEAWLAD
jgi:thiamine-phosphate pyrophosphorylase